MKTVSKSSLMYHVARGEMRESFIHEELGVFDVTAMREIANRKAELIRIDIDQVEPFVRANRVFEQARVDSLPENAWRLDPILYVLINEGPPHGTSYLLVDGAHRVIRRVQEGMDSVDAFVLTEADIIRPDYSKWGSTQDILGLDWGGSIESLKEKSQ